MARIRSIKPQFWEDEKVSRLSIKGRLLFIGTWNFADDVGIIPWQPVFIRSRIFTYDDFTLDEVRQIQQELEKERFVSTYVSNGCTYAVILNFRKHQKINKPQKSFSPIPPEPLLTTILTHTNMSIQELFTESSVNTTGTITEHSVGEREGGGEKEKEKEIDKEKDTPTAAKIFKHYETNIALINPTIADRINDAINTYPEQWIIDAITEAAIRSVKNWNYIETILKRWETEGRNNDNGNGHKITPPIRYQKAN